MNKLSAKYFSFAKRVFLLGVGAWLVGAMFTMGAMMCIEARCSGLSAAGEKSAIAGLCSGA